MDVPHRTEGRSLHAARALRVLGEYRRRALDPVDRFSEVIFGLVMVLTFTCAFSVAEGGRQTAREMFRAALACNVAWGLVDAVMYVLASIAGRSRLALVFRGIRDGDDASARAIVRAALPEGVAALADEAEADRLVARARALPRPPLQSLLEWSDLRGAAWSAVLVVMATFPPTLPFLLVADPTRALRISNGVALASLFLAGGWLGRATGLRPWLLGLAMAVVGAALVAVAIALGG
jgi:VIT1/CCC1 family predicted Fe2+/Mn2+ transporter